MKRFKDFCDTFILEARPASSFKDYDMNQAYGDSLKKFKKIGVQNANTFTIWDFMFRELPEFFKTDEILAAKRKSSGTNLRWFVLDLLKRFPNEVDFQKLAQDINDEVKILTYVNRIDKGNRHKGMWRDRIENPKEPVIKQPKPEKVIIPKTEKPITAKPEKPPVDNTAKILKLKEKIPVFSRYMKTSSNPKTQEFYRKELVKLHDLISKLQGDS